MGLKNIVVFVEPSNAGATRARYAVELARRHGAHLIGIFVASSDGPIPANAYVRGRDAMRRLIELHDANAIETTNVASRNFNTATKSADITYEFRIIREIESDDTKLHCLHADLVIVGHPRPGGLPLNSSAEGLLLATGIPFLIVPDGWPSGAVAQRVLLAWNASREARRAITDSLPLLSAAQSVSIVVIDSAKNRLHGENPGADVAVYLSRHGAHVTTEQIDSNGSPIADVILQHAVHGGFDLIVLGAYSHARVREAVFGGVTRSLLKLATIPMLIAH